MMEAVIVDPAMVIHLGLQNVVWLFADGSLATVLLGAIHELINTNTLLSACLGACMES